MDGAKRMQILINDLLTFSRVGRASDVRVTVPLDEPLDAAATALSAVIEETGAVIERPGQLPEVVGDPTLLGDAVAEPDRQRHQVPGRGPRAGDPDHGGPGSRTGDGSSASPTTASASPAEFAEKIFVIFQRLHGRDAYPGTGIGLALCKRIVEHHGGEICLDTSYPGGARLYFTLPAPAPAARPGPPEIIGTLTLPEGIPHVRPGTDRSPAGRG